MSKYQNDEHFKYFAKSLRDELKRYPKDATLELIDVQKGQILKLNQLEEDFRIALAADKRGEEVYQKFISLILDENENVLTSRVYFRERQDTFSKTVGAALKARNHTDLQKYHVNWLFVNFALKAVKWPKTNPVLKIAKKLEKIRDEIILTNTPLALSRARIFFNKTPQAHLSHMDLCMIGVMGLISAVDKFVVPEDFGKIFRSVCVGRITGYHISSYSATLVHLYPQDHRKLYRANKVARKYATPEGIDFEKMVSELNAKAEDPSQITSVTEIASIMAASSTVSADSTPPTSESEEGVHETNLDHYAVEPAQWPDQKYEDAEARFTLYKACEGLTPFERKLLRLKGLAL
jgi:RNA polymerase sigma factor (sigma-70 family)